MFDALFRYSNKRNHYSYGQDQDTGIDSDTGDCIEKRISQRGIARFSNAMQDRASESTRIKFSPNWSATGDEPIVCQQLDETLRVGRYQGIGNPFRPLSQAHHRHTGRGDNPARPLKRIVLAAKA